MEKLDLGPPIETLRSLGALTKEDGHCVSSMTDANTQPASVSVTHYNHYDPISRGILSLEEAHRTIQM